MKANRTTNKINNTNKHRLKFQMIVINQQSSDEWIPTFAEWLIRSILGNNKNTRSLINFIHIDIFLKIDEINEYVFLCVFYYVKCFNQLSFSKCWYIYIYIYLKYLK